MFGQPKYMDDWPVGAVFELDGGLMDSMDRTTIDKIVIKSIDRWQVALGMYHTKITYLTQAGRIYSDSDKMLKKYIVRRLA